MVGMVTSARVRTLVTKVANEACSERRERARLRRDEEGRPIA